MSVALIVLLPFLGAIFPALMIRSGRDACSIATAAVNVLALALLLTHLPAVLRGESVVAGWQWVPQLGLEVRFLIDGLSMLFAAMILAIGLLVVIYARFYLSRKDPMGNFYTYLLLFQGAMVGVVLSGNLLLLIVFWELTSLSSFLLIGFWGHLPAGRQGARMALAITAAGGLALIGGVLLLGGVAGSYNLTEILPQADRIRQSEAYPIILGLILLGCFTKSAQFPFHFWLPHAMAAPTPVSAYLHSATMVKAGIYLMARLWPVMSGTDEWFYLVATTGLITMVVGAVIALYEDDLKGLLAYSTVSHLGLITMLLGIGTESAAIAAVLHIIGHATFKAALFMNAGIVDHEAGTRDLRRLGGLRQSMPITATLGIIAAASMAGLPPLNGFLSKEMMLEEAAHTKWIEIAWLFPVVATFAAMASVAYSLRYLFHVFFGSRRDAEAAAPHDPSIGLWGPPAILVVLVVLIGLFPETAVGAPLRVASAAVLQRPPAEFHLALWHGWTPAAWMSAIAIALGAIVVIGYPISRRAWSHAPAVNAKTLFDLAVTRGQRVGRSINESLHNGSQQFYIFLIALATLLLCLTSFLRFEHGSGDRPLLEANAILIVAWLLVAGACVLVVLKHRNRLLALITVNVIGLISSLAFVYLSAPDLALTQIAVEVVTLILMLLALYFLPNVSTLEDTSLHRYRDGGLACVVGLGMGALTWMVMTRDVSTLSRYYLDNALLGGGGRNVVNVILVDFRGFDTYGEIMVLAIAALAIYAMLEGLVRGEYAKKLAAWRPEMSKSANRHPLMMVVITRVMLPPALMVGVYIFLRGHNLPGGGFIAALVVSIALIMQYMASGFQWAAQQVRFDYHALIGAGGLVAAATGIGAMVLDLPFLTSGYTHLHLPVIGDLEVASAMFFDAGVFLTVVGAVMLALAQLSLLGTYTFDFSTNEEPMDIDPSGRRSRRKRRRNRRAAPKRYLTESDDDDAIADDADDGLPDDERSGIQEPT
ncbi:MAG: monovalent cation/H+ antiporter subunit A [Planctomycetaceae bacterium]